MTLKSKSKKAKFVQKEESVINLVSAKQRVRRRNVQTYNKIGMSLLVAAETWRLRLNKKKFI